MIGKIFNNRYQIIEKLGAGGTAIVYRGQDMLLNRMVTIKILRDEHASNGELVRRFRHEAQAVASLSHPNIVAVYDVGFEENMHYIVMEFVEGESLKEYIKRCGVLKLSEACNIITQVLAGVEHAHEHGIIHRDLKPHNILLGKDGRAKVTDFGIAVGMTDITLTYSTSSRIMGSVHYISPEQVQGLTVTDKSDIYSLGVMLYEMLTGRLPFVGETPISIAMQHVQGELLLPHQINPNVPMGLSYVVMRAMRKNPETRYESCAEMALAVRDAYQTALAGAGERELPAETSPAALAPARAKNRSAAPREQTGREAPRRESGLPPAPRKLKAGRIALLAGAVVLVAAIVLIAGKLAGILNVQEETVKMPNLINMPKEEAESALADLGLTPIISTRTSAVYEAGRVMEQSIDAGNEVTVGRTVDIVISEGEETVTVPDLMGSSQKIAKLTLANLGLTATISEEYDEEVAEGAVIFQSPAANSKVAPGSAVELLISLGPEPQKFYMESLVGKTLEEATAYIDQMQLNLVLVTRAVSYEYDADYVIGQSIPAGTETQTNAEITIQVSDGPGPENYTTYNVNYFIPQDFDEDGRLTEMMHAVKITVSDDMNSREVFSQQLLGGSNISTDVAYYGSATITVSVDGEAVKTVTIP